MKKTLSIFLLSAVLSTSAATPVFAGSSTDADVLSCAGYEVNFKEHDPALVAAMNLQLTEPQIVAMDTNKSCAVVVWNTDKLSTSQVVFAKKGEKYDVDILNKDEKEYWGYPHGSKQNFKADIYHVMIIQGLEKGETYSLRAVSRAHGSSLPFMSPEFEFKFENARYNTDSNVGLTPLQDGTVNKNEVVQRKSHYLDVNTQKTWAESINRLYAPSQNEGKFVFVDAGSQAEEGKVSAAEEPNAGEALQGNLATQDLDAIQEDELVDVIGAANAGKSLEPLWYRVKNFFKNLFGMGGDLAPEKEDYTEESSESSTNENINLDLGGEKSASSTANLENTGDYSEDSSVVVSIKSVNDKEEVNLKDFQDQVLSFSSEETSEESATSVEAGMDALAKSSIAAASSAQNIFERFGILALIIPVLIIISALYLVQWSLSKTYEWFSGKVLLFWMISFALVALLFALIKNVPLALSFLAFFLITLAWHLFNIAVSDIDELENLESVDKVDIDKN